MSRIVDLSVSIGEDTLSPPSVSTRLKLTSYHRGPGFWQASKVEMVLHTGSHVDFLGTFRKTGRPQLTYRWIGSAARPWWWTSASPDPATRSLSPTSKRTPRRYRVGADRLG